MRYFSCRDQFAYRDIEFLADSIKSTDSDKDKIIELFFDEKCRDKMLDSPRLFGSVFSDEKDMSVISLRFYFYVAVRNLMKDYGVDNKDVSDYVSEMLTRFFDANLDETYLFDMIQKENGEENEEKRFDLIVHRADSLLLLTGIFPKMLSRRNERHGAPRIEFYEDCGSRTYLSLSTNRYAEKNNLSESFDVIGHDFHRIRSSLNCLMISK